MRAFDGNGAGRARRSDVFDRAAQVVRRHELRQERDRARRECSLLVFGIVVAAANDDPRPRAQAANERKCLKAVHHRHGEVEDHDLRLQLLRTFRAPQVPRLGCPLGRCSRERNLEQDAWSAILERPAVQSCRLVAPCRRGERAADPVMSAVRPSRAADPGSESHSPIRS